MADTPKHTPTPKLRKPPEEKQSRKFTVRVTPAEFEEIHEKAASASLGVGEFCRRCSLQRKIVSRADRDLIYQLGRVGNNLNQIAKIANREGILRADLDETLEQFRALFRQILKEE